MSLLEEYSDSYTQVIRVDSEDEYGSYITEYTDGVTFEASLAFTNEVSISTSEALGIRTNFQLMVPKDIVLSFHDLVRRNSDGKIFRVTSEGSNVYTPESSDLNLRYVDLEDWSLEDNNDRDNES